jgi:hypothetical protein
MSFTVEPTRSTPSRSGKSINGTRAVLGSGSCLGKEMNEGIDLKSILQCKTETLTLDLKSKDAKDRGEKDLPWDLPPPPEPPPSPASHRRALSGQTGRAMRSSARRRRAVWAKEAPSHIRSTAVHSPSWGTHSPARGPAAAPPLSSGSPWTIMPLSGSRMVRG